jgi:transposase
MLAGTKMETYDIREAGPGPIISNICRQLEVRKTINEVVPWDPKQCLLDPGTHVTALIINILCRRDPLYRVEEFYQEQDLELLFGTHVEPNNFNDDALGSTLDKIYAAGAKKVFSAVVLKAQLKEDIVCRVLHGDTTARLVYGNYRQVEGLNVTYGYNKEHRTDLKQYKVGLVVTEDGFPVIGEILDGNLDDKSWNKQLLSNLPAHFNLEELKKIVYVADSALVTQDSLEAIGDDLRFISRLPDTFNLAAELTQAAFTGDSWVELGKLTDGKNSASYKVQEFRRSLYGRTYRFLVVHSDHLDQRKLKSLNTQLKKRKTRLEKAVSKFIKQTFACEADAKEALKRFLKEQQNDFYPLSGSVEKLTEPVKRHKPGRPAKDDEPALRTLYKVDVQIGELDEKAYRRAKEHLSCFVLISNIFDGYSNCELLKEYKQQTVVENRFKFVKHPLYVGPLWLQKKERLEAMSYVILMALAVYIILQRRVRLALEKEDEPLKVTGDKKSFEPTGNKILELFKPVKIVYIKEGGIVKRFLPERYLELSRAMKMIGFKMEIFIKPRSP